MRASVGYCLFCRFCLFASCASTAEQEAEVEQPDRDPKEIGTASDSLALAWGADTAWAEVLLNRPTFAWQDYFSEPRKVFLHKFSFVDAYRAGDTLRVLLYGYMPEVAVDAVCDRDCQAGLPELQDFGYYSFAMDVDTVLAAYSLPVYLDGYHGGDDYELAFDEPKPVRTLIGRISSTNR